MPSLCRIAAPIASIAVLMAVLGVSVSAVAAEKPFGGDDAAYVDWAFKNCNFVSTKKEHDLADAARAKPGDAFQKSYEQQFYKIAGEAQTPVDIRHTCEHITEWYGPIGKRIEALVTTKAEKTEAAGTSIGTKSSPSGKSGGGGGRGGGGRRGGGG